MDFLNNKKQALILAEKETKEKILKYMDKHNILKPIKIMNIEEFKKQVTFTYDENAIYDIEKKYNVKRNVALTYLKNLYYIDDSTSSNMLFLKQIKEELESKNLLITHPLKKTYEEFYYIGYDSLTKYEKFLIKDYPFQKIEKGTYEITEAYLLDTIEEEITFVMERIMELIEKNVSQDKIILTNLTKEYYIPLFKIASRYNLTIDLNKPSFYATEEYKKAKEKILAQEPVEVTKNTTRLLARLNELKEVDKNDLSFILDDLAKQIKLTNKTDIRVENLLDNYFLEDEYIFVLNANETSMPHIHKDEDFLYDKIKPSILENTSELNELEEEKCKNALLGIKNKTITLKKNHNGPMRPSPLLTEIKEIKLDYSTYSNKINEYNLIDSLDLKRKYGMISKNLHTLQNHYPIAYQSYDSTFKKVPKEKILEKVNHNLVLSYSSLNQYYECAYHFYLDHILRLLPYTQNFKAYLGSLCHAILEEKPNDLNIFKENYMQTHPYNFTYKDLFFIDKIIKEMPSILEFEKELQKHSTFKIEKTEEKLYYKLDTKTDITLMGIIDKMMLNESHVSVIDYKTGQVKIQLNDVIHGLSMQLPIYALLIAKNFQDKKIAGIFIQNILENNFKNIKNKTIKEQKENSLRLNGYMIDNEDIISKFDSTYLDSRFIASMKKSKNGFYPYTKILSETKLNNLINLAEEKVKEAAFAIENADFKINPKKLRGENISCAYCPFKDICYFDKEEIELENKEDLSFLGGEV